MKRKKWMMLVPVILCLVVFFGYRYRIRQNTDSNAPKIEISEELLRLSVLDPEEALLQGITASDREDGDVTASLTVESIRLVDPDGTASVSYAAFDQAGNVSKATRQVCFTDYESPRFSLSAPLLFTQSGSVDALNYIHARDMLDGDITRRIRATVMTEDSVSSVGNHVVEFRVTNSLGETVKLELPLVVYASGTYQASMSLTDYLIYLPAGSDFDPARYLKNVTYRNETISLENGMPENVTLRTEGAVDTATAGVYCIDYTVNVSTEAVGMAQSQTYSAHSRLIVVVEG